MGNEKTGDVILFDDGGQLVEKELIKTQCGFDGMTGEPKVEYSVKAGFDGMTGEPTYVQVEAAGFDHETGTRIYKKAGTASTASEDGFAAKKPEGPSPIDAAKSVTSKAAKGGAGKMILIGVAAVAVLAVVVAGLALSGVFLDKHDKLLLAAYNTVKDDTIGGAFVDAGKLIKSGQVTAEYDGDVKANGVSASIKGTTAGDVSKGKYYANLNVDISGVTEQEVQVYMDDSVIQCALPDITKKVYEYNYTKESKGFLAEKIEDETHGSIEDVNTIISSLHTISKSSPKYKDKLSKAMRKEFRKVKLKKAEKKEVEIDGKDRKLAGYEFEITEKDVDSFFDAYKKTNDSMYGKEQKKFFAAMDNLGGNFDEDDLEDSIDKIKDGLEDLDGAVVRIYTYKNKLACVELDYKKVKASVEFRGGDTRTSEIRVTVKANGEKGTIKKKSSVSDGKEKGSISVDGSESIDYVYDRKSGKFEVGAGSNSIEGTFLVTNKEIQLKFDGDKYGVDADMKISVKKGARINALKGKTVDIGNADEDTLKDIVEEIQDEFSDLDSRYTTEEAPAATEEWAYPAAEEAAPAEEW